MKKILYTIFFIVSILITGSCDNNTKDEELPVIDMSAQDAFPLNCTTVYRGESFTFKARFTDNVELGSYSIEMHNNFDHHTHSTSVVECELSPIKTAVNPLLFINEFSIPQGLKDYTATVTINVPATVDTGDYHFMIRVTDKSGWQAFEGISVKVANRN
jgi:hypothetical protein